MTTGPIGPDSARRHRRIRMREVSAGWQFQVIAANGEPQATSEPYASKQNAERGARDLFPDDEITYVVTDDR